MVQLCRQDTMVYMVLDGERPIGRVVAPAGEPMLGPGGGNGAPAARTPSGVLRSRPAPETFSVRPR